MRLIHTGSRNLIKHQPELEMLQFMTISKPKSTLTREDLPTQQEIDNLLAVCADSSRDKALIAVHSEAGTRIAEEAPGFRYCGTHVSGWMQGLHPTSLGETVTRTVCFQWTSYTCYWSSEIKVRNCGQFFLYRLVDTPGCNFGYCAK